MTLRKTLIAAVAVCMSASLASATDKDGGKDTGNGGDGYTIEFAGLAQSVLKHWDELEIAGNLGITKERFEFAIQETEVHSTVESLHVGDFEVDAKNYPFCDEGLNPRPAHCGLIVINRARWDAMGGDVLRKTALVFHEYLGALGMNRQRFDDFYEVSARNFDRLKELLSRQTRVDLSFLCLLEVWSAEKNRTIVMETLETKTGSAEKWFELQKQDFVLEIRESLEDLLSPTLMNGLNYSLYKKNRGELPDYKNPISHDRIVFKGSKNSVRIWNSPELQLTCYRTFEDFKR